MAKRRAHGEGSVVQLADGSWRAVVPIGEGRRKWIRGATRAEVVKKAMEAKASRDQGLPVADGRIRMGPFLDQWLKDSVRPSVRPRTYDSYSGHVRMHLKPRLGSVRLADLTPGHVQRLVNDLQEEGLSANTAVRVHATLRRALNHAERWGLATRNVARLVDLPKVEQQKSNRSPPMKRGHSCPPSLGTVLRPSTPSRSEWACAKARHWGCGGRTLISTTGLSPSAISCSGITAADRSFLSTTRTGSFPPRAIEAAGHW